MTPRINHDETKDVYELGDDIEGVFVSFASIDGPAVRARVTAAADAEQAASSSPATPEAPEAPAAPAIDPAEYADNGDGTYTRSADGVTGRFTPAGFTPDAA
jgi:hypothetical protein